MNTASHPADSHPGPTHPADRHPEPGRPAPGRPAPGRPANGQPAQNQPSGTALLSAAARAAHLIVDGDPPIFIDRLAETLLGDRAEELLGYQRAYRDHLVMSAARAQTVCRSRYTEDRLAASVRSGVRQYVILGAGLDSFAYRSELADRVRVFEVDVPATQEWKRRRLAEAGIRTPSGVRYVPTNFETGALADALDAAGFDRSRPALVSWLGVTVYLTTAAIADTLAVLGGLAPGTEIILDHMLPGHLRDDAGQAYAETVQAFAAQGGEPWLTFLAPEEVAALLHCHGLETVAHVRQREMVDPELWQRGDCLRPANLLAVTRARVRSSPAARLG